MISSRFLKSTLAYSISGSLPMLSGLILLPFYTNLLATSEYGVLMLYVAFSLFVQILVSYSIDAYLGSHYTEVSDDPKAKKELLSNSAGLLLVIGAFFIVSSLFIGSFAFDLTFNRSQNLMFFPYGLMSVVTGFFNGFFRAYTYLLVYEKKPGTYFVYNLVNFVLTIVLSLIGLYWFPNSLIGPMYGRLLSGAGIFIISLAGFWLAGGISFRFSKLKGLHVFCIPYVLYVLLTWVSANTDRFIINDILDPAHVAVFDFGVKCTLLIDFVQTGLISAIYPQVFSIWNKSGENKTSKESNRYFNSFTGLSMLMICLFMVFIPIGIPLFVSKNEFYSSFLFLGILVGSFATRGVYYYFVSIILHLKKTRLLLYAFAVSVVVQLPLTWFLTKEWGINGAVWSALIAKVVQVIALYFFTRRYFEIKMNVVKMLILPLLLIAFLGLIWGFTTHWNLLHYIGLSIIVFIILVFQYKKEIVVLLQKFGLLKNIPVN